MTSNKDFRKKEPAAVFQHKLLTGYPTVWAAKLGSPARSRTGTVFVDGHAGERRYESGDPGSPAIALRVGQRTGDDRAQR